MNWTSVEDRLPEMRYPYRDAKYRESDRCLVFDGFNIRCGIYGETYTTNKKRWQDDSGRVVAVTHWMPLPATPQHK